MKVLILTKKRLIVLAACVVTAAICWGLASNTAQKVVATMTERREIPIYYVDTKDKVCAISFDAAWGNEQTASLLDTLDEYNVKTTFFLVKQWVDEYPDSVEEIARRGHDVGNHSATHPHMANLSAEEQKSEIAACNDAVKGITGSTPTLFRAPYGEYDDKLVQNLRGMGMYCVQWNVDSLDWKDLSADEIVDRIRRKLCPGAIVLLHNGGKHTAEALPKIISAIREQGYRIVPISELIPAGDYRTDHEGKMILTEPSENSTEKSSG